MEHARNIPVNPGVINSFAGRYAFLSNGYIEPDGSFVEREFQAAKAQDPGTAQLILGCQRPFGPGGSKELGRRAEMRPDWEQIKFQVMSGLVLWKFRDHPSLAAQLLATGDALIIEGNKHHDNTWGDCYCSRPLCGLVGLNWLGQIHMCVREALRAAG